MKNLRKVMVLVLALLVVFAFSVTAFAADGDITVNGPVNGATYEAYLMFDVTVNAQNKPSYTIPAGSTIADVTGFGDTFTTTTNGGKTYVQAKDGANVIAWIKANAEAIKTACGDAKDTATGAGNSVTLSTGALGYYMVYSKNGDVTAVSVDTTAKTATVDSKLPNKPSVDPEEGKKVATSEDGEKTDVTTMEVGQTAYFTVTFTATNYEVENGVSTPITQYVVTDTPDGFDINEDSVKVKVNNADYAIAGKTITTAKSDAGVLTVTIPWDQTTYNTSNTVVVTYTATLTNKNLASGSSNKASVKYNETTIPGTPETHVYNYTLNVEKVDADQKTTKLEGAKFVLKQGEKFYKVDATTGAVTWVADQKDATEVTTNANGVATFQGLKAGDYTLVETVAPEGYNLAAPKPVTLAAVTEELENDTTLTVTSQVEDKAGSVLPSTGGVGTTIFYILGSLLVVGCGIVLVSKKRVTNR